MAWKGRDAPTSLFVLALLAAAALIVALTWQLTFYQDTWAFLMERQGSSAGDFLRPHNEHLVVFQVALEKLLIGIFGMGTARPEFLVMVLTLLASATMVFVYVRRRTDAWLAAFAAALLLFLGSSWEVILWPFEIEFVVPLATGIGALLLLEREDERADAWAGLLLVLGLGFGSLGLSFVLAAAVDVVVKHRRRGWARLWIVALPLVLYLVWYAGWGRDAEHHLTLINVLKSPLYAAKGFAAAVSSLLGLAPSKVAKPIVWGVGVPVAAGVLVAGAWSVWRRWPPRPSFWPIAIAALSYWLLAAFNYIPGREPWASRYLYTGAAFVLLVGAEVLHGVRLGPRARALCAGLTALVLVPNVVWLFEGADHFREQTAITRADTGAMEIARRTIAPEFRLGPEIAGTPSLINIDAADYFRAVQEHGSPAYSPQEIESASAAGRSAADVVLASALPISAIAADGDSGGSGCTPVQRPSGAPVGTGTTKVVIPPGAEATLRLRRFASGEFPFVVGKTEGDTTVSLTIPADTASGSWFLMVEGTDAAKVCR